MDEIKQIYDIERAKSAERMNATFYNFTTAQKNAHAKHMLGCSDYIRYDNAGLVIAWFGRGCPMVINKDTLKLTYYQTMQEAIDVCLDKHKEGTGVQTALF